MQLVEKPSRKDVDEAIELMAVLNAISSGWFPWMGDPGAPMTFDPDDAAHLRRFYDSISATLEAAPGWPLRVIGGMCWVFLLEKYQIVDPDSETLALHPRFEAVQVQRDALLAVLKEIHEISYDAGAVDRARAAIAKAEGFAS